MIRLTLFITALFFYLSSAAYSAAYEPPPYPTNTKPPYRTISASKCKSFGQTAISESTTLFRSTATRFAGNITNATPPAATITATATVFPVVLSKNCTKILPPSASLSPAFKIYAIPAKYNVSQYLNLTTLTDRSIALPLPLYLGTNGRMGKEDDAAELVRISGDGTEGDDTTTYLAFDPTETQPLPRYAAVSAKTLGDDRADKLSLNTSYCGTVSDADVVAGNWDEDVDSDDYPRLRFYQLNDTVPDLGAKRELFFCYSKLDSEARTFRAGDHLDVFVDPDVDDCEEVHLYEEFI